MFSSSFTMTEQEHRQWTPYKRSGPQAWRACGEETVHRIERSEAGTAGAPVPGGDLFSPRRSIAEQRVQRSGSIVVTALIAVRRA